MVATANVVAATASLLLVSFSKPHYGAKISSKHKNEQGGLHIHRIMRKSDNYCGGIQVKASSQYPKEVNESKVCVMNDLKAYDNPTSHTQKAFINQFPWRDGHLFCEKFPIRSYEIRADRTASTETIMNYLQDTAINHAKSIGLLGDGFGTPEMSKKNLFWALTKMKVIVDRYPTWGDVVQVSTWMAQNGKNRMRCDWLLHDSQTGQILARASSNYVMMNKETRRLSKIPDEVRREIEVYFVDAPPVVDDDCRKLPKLDVTTADYVLRGLRPRWSDLDINQHVNNVKYIAWILESIPQVVEKYELASITLEYRRECRNDCILKSVTSILSGCPGGDNSGIAYCNHVVCQHMLLFEGGSDDTSGDEILKAVTKWRPK